MLRKFIQSTYLGKFMWGVVILMFFLYSIQNPWSFGCMLILVVYLYLSGRSIN
jgi:hypothetical protein